MTQYNDKFQESAASSSMTTVWMKLGSMDLNINWAKIKSALAKSTEADFVTHAWESADRKAAIYTLNGGLEHETDSGDAIFSKIANFDKESGP